MLTQQDMASMLLRGQVAQANMIKAIFSQEIVGCDPEEWNSAVCLSHQLQALQFSLRIGDYTSDDAVAAYNNVSTQASADTPTTNPNAQSTGGTITVNNPSEPQSPAGRWVDYDDPKWNDDHTIYSEPLWAGYNPQIQLNGQRFLDPKSEFTSALSGGFSLPAEAIDGDVYVILF